LWQKLIWHGLDLFNPVALIKVVRLLHRYAPDVVITHNFKGWSLSLFVAVKALRVPLISVLHDYNIVCEKTTMFKDGNCASVCLGCKPRASLATMAWRPDLVVTVSDAMWQLLCSVRPAMGSHLQATLYPEPDSTPNLFARDAPGEQLKVGYLGRIDYTKGVEDLIEASRGLPMEVRIAGPIDTDHARSLVRKYSDLTTVTFLGSQDRDNFLASVGVLVVPSKWREPYGRVAREALNAGCRVIVADHGGLREAAAGFHGVSTYPAGDVPALRECLLRVLVTEGPSTLPHAEVRADSSVGEHLMLMVQTLVEGAQSRRTVRDAFRGKVAGVWSPLDAIASDRTR
jgi:glycosyltransferase involved in cell wall biosynthesis